MSLCIAQIRGNLTSDMERYTYRSCNSPPLVWFVPTLFAIGLAFCSECRMSKCQHSKLATILQPCGIKLSIASARTASWTDTGCCSAYQLCSHLWARCHWPQKIWVASHMINESDDLSLIQFLVKLALQLSMQKPPFHWNVSIAMFV